MILEEFEELVREGIRAIPQEFLDKLENVDIIVEENPTLEQIEKLKIRNNYVLFGLYEGIPKTKRSSGYSQVLPDKITIFKNPIENFSKNKEEIKQIIKNTVWHEFAHHFGMDEDRVRKAEIRRQANQKNKN
jgi:predicted Zn-dependent protease with MMP-like domain